METIPKIRMENLQNDYGIHKQIPERYEKIALTALSHFPELRAVPIAFKASKTLFPVSSRPFIGRLMVPKQKRAYQIIISKKTVQELSPALLPNLSFSAQVGIIGQQLAHIVEYEQMKTTRILKQGLAYPFYNLRNKYEKSTNCKVIEHGLGWELFDWASEIRKNVEDNPVLQHYSQFYLSPEAILEYIQEHFDERTSSLTI